MNQDSSSDQIEVVSTLLGHFTVPRSAIITLPEGLIGIPDRKRFVLLERENFLPFSYLQSLDQANFTLVVISPFLVRPGYEIKVDRSDFSDLGIQGPSDCTLLAIVSFAQDPQDMTVNLKAPILVNIHSHQGRQVIDQNTLLGVAEPLFRTGGTPAETMKEG